MHGKWKSTREDGKTKFKCIIRVNIKVNSPTEKQRLSDWLRILLYTAHKTHAWNKTTQKFKAVLRGRFTALQAYLKKQEKSQINNLTLHLKLLEKEEMKNPRVSRRKEILKIRAEINADEIF